MALFAKFKRREAMGPEDPTLVSIVENLNNILNTKRDYGTFLVDLGIRDLNEYNDREHIAVAVIEEVRHNIDAFEPRVELVEVTLEEGDNPLFLSFKIHCKVRETTRALRLVLDTQHAKYRVET